MVYLTSIAVLSCCFRLILEDVSFNCCGVTFGIGHTDPMAFGSLLTPILAAHGYIKGKSKDLAANSGPRLSAKEAFKKMQEINNRKPNFSRVDDPDA